MTRGKAFLGGVVVLGLGGVLTFAIVHEATVSRAAAPRPTLPGAPRPALTAAEEAYAAALWPIHSEVKVSALRMTFGGLSYKMKEIDRSTLRARVEAARQTYHKAALRIRALQPPPSLQKVHAEYAEAVQLYEQSAAEMGKVFKDGRDDHLLAAYPLSREAGEKMLRAGDVLWPGEYVPN
jgi:hypothetical protein